MGVFLATYESISGKFGLPHVRGGVSRLLTFRASKSKSSPRAWGCFVRVCVLPALGFVFPTCVGVFPRPEPPAGGRLRLPHVRGGVSTSILKHTDTPGSSPRAWGCFVFREYHIETVSVFPTCVGVFPFLVSIFFSFGRSSPRAWGCFCLTIYFIPSSQVFPTCVGVFLCSTVRETSIVCLPHVRGGVSDTNDRARTQDRSSPRAWGCFLQDFT